MSAKILISALIITLFTACDKDKFTTKPQLTFDNFNTKVINPGGQLIITLNYTDKEGDIQDSIYWERIAINCVDTIRGFYKVPADVPTIKNAEGEIVISYSYFPDETFPQIGDPRCRVGTTTVSDTSFYRFALSDKAGNVSDTLSTPQLYIIKR